MGARPTAKRVIMVSRCIPIDLLMFIISTLGDCVQELNAVLKLMDIFSVIVSVNLCKEYLNMATLKISVLL